MQRAFGLHHLTWEPNLKWVIPGSYPREWLILTAVMLLQHFVGLFMGFSGLLDGSTFRVQPMLIRIACAWWLKPPDPPPICFNSVEWGEEWDTTEYIHQHCHKVLHLTGFATEYVAAYAGALDEVLGAIDMKLTSRSAEHTLLPVRDGKIRLPSHFAAYLGHQRFHVPLFKCGCELTDKPMDIIFDTGATISFTHDKDDFTPGTFIPQMITLQVLQHHLQFWDLAQLNGLFKNDMDNIALFEHKHCMFQGEHDAYLALNIISRFQIAIKGT